jgi:hypothetical protein
VKKVALIACSNGYGHIRRLLLLSQEIELYNGVQTTIFAPAKVAYRLVCKLKIHTPKLVDFNTETSQSNWISGSSKNWYKSLPDLKSYDVVISDNLIEILHVRPDAWISGSFFWHESLKKFPQKQKNESRDLLNKYKPRMVSSKLFSSSYLAQYTNLYEVGLFSNCIDSKIGFNQTKDILIATGKGGEVEGAAKVFINSLVHLKNRAFDKVWIEPTLLPDKHPKWMIKATFTTEMYRRVSVAIIRPGVGTVTDSLINKVKIFPFYEKSNNEMIRNVDLLYSNGYSGFTSNIIDAWNDAISYLSDDYSQEKYIDNIKNLNISGGKEFAKIVLSSI